MRHLLILVASLCAGLAAGKDLSEKVFTFPGSGGTSSVKLIPSKQQPLTALTMCMRYFSAETRGQGLFSLALPSQSNAFLLFKPSAAVYRLHVNGQSVDISGLPALADEWNSVCWTWQSTNGLTTLWINGKRSPRKVLAKRTTLQGVPSIILGQDQDSYGGGFDQAQSFVGDMTDVHLWDTVISPCEIRFYMEGSAFTPGNLLNWKNLRYSITGPVSEEPSDFDKLSCF